MTIEEKIQKIHGCKKLGIFIESGTAGIVASMLMMEKNASSTVYMSECPYNKEFQHGYYENQAYRSISKETVLCFVDRWKNIDDEKYIFAQSWQVGNYNDISTHGWIAIYNPITGNTHVYHCSIHDSMNRADYIHTIGRLGIDILFNDLYDCAGEKPEPPVYLKYIDIHGDDPHLPLVGLKHSDDEGFICFDTDGNCIRMEDMFRSKEEIALYKGSFNPLHIVHIEFAQSSANRPIFMISLNTIDKEALDVTELKKRIAMINAEGFQVIVCNKGMFRDNIDFIRRKFDCRLLFLVGSDTITRISTEDLQWFNINNISFMVKSRSDNDISSTRIRQLLDQNKIDEAKTLVSEKTLQILMKSQS